MGQDTKATSHEARGDDETAAPLERRGDNVGQSGRWGRGDAGAKRYGHEECWHDSEHPAGSPAEAGAREPNADRPNGTPYADASAHEGRIAPPEKQDAQPGDDQSRYRPGSYADAGGIIGDDPSHPGDGRWEDEGGAGYGEDYGSGRDAGGNGTERAAPKRRPS